MRRPARRLLLIVAGLLLVALLAVAWTLGRAVSRDRDLSSLPAELASRTPGELIRRAQLRLQGHPLPEKLLLPALRWAQLRVERVPAGGLPTLGKGWQPRNGSSLLAGMETDTVAVATADQLARALAGARAGQTILLGPGRYRVNANLRTGAAGTRARPITVRSDTPEQTVVEFTAIEGFIVDQPYWTFENLHIRGVCEGDGYCEHAFHVVGNAHHTRIRNNLIEDFNAHLKVNGLGDSFPDDGLVERNTITNTRARETHVPVTPIDLVAASRWVVADNLISNFVKADGDRISYGVFMKGAGDGGRIERNLVVCTPGDVSVPGQRVGISFGGGGTGKPYCRDLACEAEHTGGVVANNIVAHCNDFGIDVNRAARTLVAHNTLVNTAGIDVRNAPASARIHGNLLEGRIRQRNHGELRAENNDAVALRDYTAAPDALDLTPTKPLDTIPSVALVPLDFCGRSRGDATPTGALAGTLPCGNAAAPPPAPATASAPATPAPRP
jgi:hypothetical protein